MEGSHSSLLEEAAQCCYPQHTQDILTASGVPCTAPCQQRSASASSSSSLCVCGEEGKAQLWHSHMVVLCMQGVTQTGTMLYPTTQTHSAFPAFWKSHIKWICPQFKVLECAVKPLNITVQVGAISAPHCAHQ